MDNEEPQLTQIANLQISHDGHKLPEQSRIPTLQIPRPFGFTDVIHQWQPMGIRVKLNLPFTSNDQDFLFAIRNGPFIPLLSYKYKDSSKEVDFVKDKPIDYTKTHFSTLEDYDSYAWNNMHPVTHATSLLKYVNADNSAVYITQYDNPPPLAAFSTMFRRWRGTMHYRIRVVSGFTTQGYIFASVIKNAPQIPAVLNEFTTTTGPPRQDHSYREAMINSYIMGDTAMFRHFEIQMPYEYPTPYYDQYAWIGKRCRPARYFLHYQDTTTTPPKDINVTTRPVQFEPHGENFIVIGLRGTLESSVQNSQVTFELEYRAGDDFQFADPFLPFPQFYAYSRAKAGEEFGQDFRNRQIPATNYTSNGYNVPSAKVSPTIRVNRSVEPATVDRAPSTSTTLPSKTTTIGIPAQPAMTPEQYAAELSRRQKLRDERLRQRQRNPRDIDEGYDTVDQDDQPTETPLTSKIGAVRSWLGSKD